VAGGVKTIVLFNRGCVLLVHMQYSPPRLTAYNMDRHISVDASADHAYLVVESGLEVYALPDFALVQRHPGSFRFVAPQPDGSAAVVDKTNRVLFLKDGRWNPVVYAVDACFLVPSRNVVYSYTGHWCLTHKHSIKRITPDAEAVVCDGTSVLILTRDCLNRVTIWANNQPVWKFYARAIQLHADELIAVHSHDKVHVWPVKWWGRRLFLLIAAGWPVQLVICLKKRLDVLLSIAY
jgi:hypothetical protein